MIPDATEGAAAARAAARRDARLLVHTAPFLKQSLTTPGLMREVLLATVPLLAAATWFFGVGALLVVGAAVAGAAGCEALFTPAARRRERLGDGSAILTGVLLGLALPPGLPMWVAFVGGAVGIGLGKLVWGGLGQNLFNPALVGRAFLQAAFPTLLTTWKDPVGPGQLLSVSGTNLALPLFSAPVDAASGATPLALMKFQGQITAARDLLVGHVGGSLGETSAGLLLLVGLVLALRRTFDWRIPVSILLAVAAFSGVLHAIDPARWPTPVFMILSGGLLYGTVFMATDPVTSPLAPRGAWIFGLGIGFLVVLIRLFGGFPEGTMYAILLMNAATPLLDRRMQPRPFGRGSATKVPK